MGILRMSMGARGGVMGRVVALVVAMAALGAVCAARASADVTYPARPTDRGAGGFIADEAKLISAEDATKIRAISEKLLTEKRVPLIVCTVTSMADHGASGWTIERYAMNVFDEWGIGSKQYEYGILLLVSKGDRKARIELGAGWTRERDAACANIMSMDIVPAFKRGDYSGGILKGVQQLDALGRVASKPVPPVDQSGAGSTAASGAPAATPAPAPQGRMADPNAASDDGQAQQQYSYSNSYPRSGRTSGGSKFGGLSLGCLAIPVIGIFMVLRVIKGALGWGGGGSGWGRSMYPGGYGGGWGSGSSFGGGGWGGSSGGGSSSGGGGGFSGGSFGGGSSGGGGASGSW